jgi:GWxTD domain-containing protein
MYSRVLQILISGFVLAIVSASSFAQPGLLRPEYKKWLEEDVHWIIGADERRDFLNLVTDDQRDDFIVKFWERRNPHPSEKPNAFKQEHYRRLAFSNEHFAAGIAGWSTDRGRVYITYGPPDAIRVVPAAAGRAPEENWLYTHLERVGNDISLEFVDEYQCGAYELRNAPPGIQ